MGELGSASLGQKLWIRFRDVGGKWRDAFTGYEVGQEVLAQATHEEVVARVAASERTVKSSTFVTYAEIQPGPRCAAVTIASDVAGFVKST